MASVSSDNVGSFSTAHLARFEFSDAGTKILMVEWLPQAAAVSATATLTAGLSQKRKAGLADRGATSAHSTQTSSNTPISPSEVAGATSGEPSGSGTIDDGAGAEVAEKNPSRGPGAVTGADAAAWEVSWPGKSTFLPARDADLDKTSSASSLNSRDTTEAEDATLASEEQRRRVFFLLPPDASIPTTVTITPPGRAPIEVKPLPAILPEGFQGETDFPGSRGVLHTIWAKKRVRELEREMKAEMRANTESVGLEMALAEKQWIQDNFLRSPPQPAVSVALGSPEATTPISPRSPVSGRLGEKLKGLKLATSAADLVPSATANTFTSVGSQSQTLSPQGGDVAVSSFSSIPRGAPVPGAGPTPVSLDAVMKGEAPGQPITDDDELFALPLSPRSPDMKKSPFSTLR